MIDQQQAQASGLNLIDPTNKAAADKAAKRAALKKLAPQLVNSDGQVDLQALQDFIDLAHTTSNNKGYELTFAGKGRARAQADSETNYELKVEKEQSKAFENTENVVIRGDNLEVLKILKQNYFEKIKLIYIDPPYNTKSENFIYKDNFKQTDSELIENFGLDENTTAFLQNVYGTRSHSGWLAFMYPRLRLARDLLRADGVIFISIDDNEQANLKIMCDEIFGEENFCASLIHQKKSGGGQANFYYKGHDTILVYAKNKVSISGLYKKDGKKLKTIIMEGAEYWYDTDVIRRVHGKYNSSEGHRNLFYEELSKAKKAKIDHKISNNEYILIKDKHTENHYVSKYGLLKDKKKLLYSILQSDNIYNLWSSAGDARVLRLLGKEKVFTTPKATDLLKMFLCNSTKDDLILDFFAGSGTTGDAVMQLNAEDGGTRKFILVQWDEAIDQKKNQEAYQFCTENNFEPLISSITIERLNRAGAQIKQAWQETNNQQRLLETGPTCPDIGYKVFSLAEKPKLVENQSGLFELENQRKETTNTLVNMLCATCKPLHTKIMEIIKDKLYNADNEIYVLGEISQTDLEPYKELKINLDGWAAISLENWLNLEVVQKENVNVVY